MVVPPVSMAKNDITINFRIRIYPLTVVNITSGRSLNQVMLLPSLTTPLLKF
jgi:hypothetical protein